MLKKLNGMPPVAAETARRNATLATLILSLPTVCQPFLPRKGSKRRKPHPKPHPSNCSLYYYLSMFRGFLSRRPSIIQHCCGTTEPFEN